MNDQTRLERLLQSENACVSMVTFEEDYALQLVRDFALGSGRHMWLWSIVGGVRDGLIADGPAQPETEQPAAGLYRLATITEPSVYVLLDLAGHLKDERTLRLLRNLMGHTRKAKNPLVLIDHRSDLPPIVQEHTTRFELSLPDEDELEQVARETLRRVDQEHNVEVDISKRHWRAILRNLRGLTRRQAEQIIVATVADDHRLDSDDVNTVLARKRETVGAGGLLQFVETPMDLSDIGGLRRLKDWLAKRRAAAAGRGAEFGLTAPRGVLMLGVQGAGKSLCAKAIAAVWQRPLLRMDVGALYDRYVGESERRLRDTLRHAERMAPIVLWIDEIEKAFASAASRSADGGLSQRMFGSLLTWMQEHDAPVFLVATANDIEALPPELLRKGRFDEVFFVDLPDASTRSEIFAIHLRKRGRDPAGFEIETLAGASDGYSGAEIEQAIVASLHDAFADKKDIDTQRILGTLHSSRPLSITMAERVTALRRWAQGRCLPAN